MLINALKRAKRARVSFETGGKTLDAISLIIDTELIRYKWASVNGNYPDYEKLIPTEFNTVAHFDTVEAIKAVNSLKALSSGKDYPIDLTIGDGKIVMPMLTTEANEQAKKDREARVETKPTDEPTEPEATEQAEAKPVAKHKPKRNRKKDQ